MPGCEFDAKDGAIAIERCPFENPERAVWWLVGGYEEAAGFGECGGLVGCHWVFVTAKGGVDPDGGGSRVKLSVNMTNQDGSTLARGEAEVELPG